MNSVGWGKNLGFMRYGDEWREIRRAFHHHFNQNSVHIYRQKSSKEAKKLIHRLLTQPDDFMQHIRTYVAHASMSDLLTLVIP